MSNPETTPDETIAAYLTVVLGLIALISLLAAKSMIVGIIGFGSLGGSLASAIIWWTLRHAK